MDKKEKTILIVVLLICIIFVVISFVWPDIPGPTDWLLAWTTWVASVVGIVVAARVFWVGSSLIRNYLLGKEKKEVE